MEKMNHKYQMPILIIILIVTLVLQFLSMRKSSNKNNEIIIIERQLQKPIIIKENKLIKD
jgi:Na+/H+ antiporter NhaC